MSKSTKVMHVIADLGSGGAERQLVELLKSNPSHILLVFKNVGAYKNELDFYKINYLELNIKKPISIIFHLFKIAKIIKSKNEMIIHSWMYNACLIIFLAKFISNIRNPIVWGIRCSNMDLKHYSIIFKLTFLLCKFFSNKANYIIYNSYAGFKYHKKSGFSNQSSKVILNGIDNKRFLFSSNYRHKLREKLHIKSNDTVIICAARVDPMKNHINLLKAFSKIRISNKKALLVLIGKGTEKLPVQDGVVSLGLQLNIENYYSVGDIIILPSKFGEGFPNVLAEGMLCKLYPIVTDVGDASNIISDIGIVVKGTTDKGIFDALEKALKIRKSRMKILQKKSMNRILMKFNIKKMAAKYNDCYKELN